jgi:hypothetical protein
MVSGHQLEALSALEFHALLLGILVLLEIAGVLQVIMVLCFFQAGNLQGVIFVLLVITHI